MTNKNKIFRFKLIIILLVINAAYTFTQWNQLTTNTTNKLNSISFYDASSGFAVGVNIILNTTNGGSTWGSHSFVNEEFLNVQFVSPSLAYACTWNNLYKWNGTSWNLAYSFNPTGTVDKIFFTDAMTGYCMLHGSVNEYLGKTTNAGNNWFDLTNFGSYYFDICFTDANTGLICGANRRIQRTTNGGLNWSPVLNPGGTENLKAVEIKNNSGFAVGDAGIVYTTTNNGLNWNLSNLGASNDFRSAAVRFNGSSPVYMTVGGTSQGLIRASNNLGSNWIGQGPLALNLNDVCDGLSPWTFYTCGYNGSVYKTTNAGGNFVSLNQSNSNTPIEFKLFQNYPNPFNPVTKIKFDLPEQGFTEIRIFDITGKESMNYPAGELIAGKYEYTFDASNLPSGVYFCRITSGNYSAVMKMILVK